MGLHPLFLGAPPPGLADCAWGVGPRTKGTRAWGRQPGCAPTLHPCSVAQLIHHPHTASEKVLRCGRDQGGRFTQGPTPLETKCEISTHPDRYRQAGRTGQGACRNRRRPHRGQAAGVHRVHCPDLPGPQGRPGYTEPPLHPGNGPLAVFPGHRKPRDVSTDRDLCPSQGHTGSSWLTGDP